MDPEVPDIRNSQLRGDLCGVQMAYALDQCVVDRACFETHEKVDIARKPRRSMRRRTQLPSLCFRTMFSSSSLRWTRGTQSASHSGEANLGALRAGAGRVGPVDILRAHYSRMLQENLHKTGGDYYIAIFSMDFLCFVHMIFGYSYIFQFQTDQSAIRTWWQSNFIASDHFLALIILFLSIVLDRVVYPRKAMRWKLVIQHVSVIGYHYWLFLLTNIGTRNVGKVFYLLKCSTFS